MLNLRLDSQHHICVALRGLRAVRLEQCQRLQHTIHRGAPPLSKLRQRTTTSARHPHNYARGPVRAAGCQTQAWSSTVAACQPRRQTTCCTPASPLHTRGAPPWFQNHRARRKEALAAKFAPHQGRGRVTTPQQTAMRVHAAVTGPQRGCGGGEGVQTRTGSLTNRHT